jgi:hypothetical protein
MKLYIIVVLYFPFLLASASSGIKINGNTKTDEQVIRSEIHDLLKNGKLSKNDIAEVKRRLWNLRIFSKVDVISTKDGEFSINIEERWTTIPIFKYSTGGSSKYMAIGLYDINTFGLNVETGAQYESLNDKAAGVVWLRKPNFMNNRNLKAGIDLWNINRSTALYEHNSTQERSAYTLEQQKVSSFLEYKWNQDFYLIGVNYTYNKDDISDFGLSEQRIEINKKNGFVPNNENINRWHTIYFHIGNLNYKNYLLEGK